MAIIECFSNVGCFEHPKHMLKLMRKKIITILRSKSSIIWAYVIDRHFYLRIKFSFSFCGRFSPSYHFCQIIDLNFGHWLHSELEFHANLVHMLFDETHLLLDLKMW